MEAFFHNFFLLLFSQKVIELIILIIKNFLDVGRVAWIQPKWSLEYFR
jgi:hypothetical protein